MTVAGRSVGPAPALQPEPVSRPPSRDTGATYFLMLTAVMKRRCGQPYRGVDVPESNDDHLRGGHVLMARSCRSRGRSPCERNALGTPWLGPSHPFSGVADRCCRIVDPLRRTGPQSRRVAPWELRWRRFGGLCEEISAYAVAVAVYGRPEPRQRAPTARPVPAFSCARLAGGRASGSGRHKPSRSTPCTRPSHGSQRRSTGSEPATKRQSYGPRPLGRYLNLRPLTPDRREVTPRWVE